MDLHVWGPYVLCSPDSEAQCRAALTDWMQRHGEQTYFDRLSRALQHIGRTDIAIGEKQMETERTLVPSGLYLLKENKSVRCHKDNGFYIKIVHYSWQCCLSLSLEKKKLEQRLIWEHVCVFSKLVYFGQESLLKTLTTVCNLLH